MTTWTCAVCEKRPAIRWEGADICLACLNRGRTARPAPTTTVLLTPSADSLLHDHLVSVALGLSAPSEAA
jgi:hypothetical protein